MKPNPSVTRLEYRLQSLNPFDQFTQAEPWEGRLGAWSCRLNDDVLSARPAVGFPTVEAARADIERMLRAWEAQAFLEGQYLIRFDVLSAELDGSTAPLPVMAQAEVQAVQDRADPIYRRENHAYPAPDASFSFSPLVKDLLEDIRGFRQGQVPLPSAAHSFLSRIESALDGRDPANALNVDSQVLDTLGELAGRGHPAPEAGQPAPAYRGPEWQWMQEALMRLALQVGRLGKEAPRARLTLSDFRTSLQMG